MADMVAMKSNDLFVAAMAVWAGYYGNDPERRKKLTADGYNPDAVQTIVNMLGDVFIKCEELSK